MLEVFKVYHVSLSRNYTLLFVVSHLIRVIRVMRFSAWPLISQGIFNAVDESQDGLLSEEELRLGYGWGR